MVLWILMVHVMGMMGFTDISRGNQCWCHIPGINAGHPMPRESVGWMTMWPLGWENHPCVHHGTYGKYVEHPGGIQQSMQIFFLFHIIISKNLSNMLKKKHLGNQTNDMYGNLWECCTITKKKWQMVGYILSKSTI